MGASRRAKKGEPARRELDDRCEMVMRADIAVAADVEDLPARRERR
jgi:hypothetical protein